MPAQCSFEGFQGVSGSIIEGQLSADGQTLNTTFRGPARDSGSITLTRIP